MNPNPPRGRRRALLAGTTALVLVVAAVLAVGALAATSKPAPRVTVAKSVHVGSVTEPLAVNTRGMPVYELAGNSAAHMLCTKANGCWSAWPPVTAKRGAKLSKGAGISGRLASFRHNGINQLTLNGHPLYTFAGDHSRGTANGNGLTSFGGTWHVFREGAASAPGGTGSGSGSGMGSGSGSGW